MGGRGSVPRAVGAVFLLSGARVAMVMLDIAPYFHQILTGMILVAVIAVDATDRSKSAVLQ